jgi:hypothetical protein
MTIRPGNYQNAIISDYSFFTGSMADEMDKALRQLMLTDGLGEISMDPTDPDVRHRRRLFLAIARGIARHLELEESSFKITLPLLNTPVVTPDIDVDMA